MPQQRGSKSSSLHPPVTSRPRERGGIALEVGGVVQSVSVPAGGAEDFCAAVSDEPRPAPGSGYWGLMLPPGCPRRALLLGLGGGTVAALLARRCPHALMVGVERNAAVLAVARSMFGLDVIPRLQVEQTDAFAWVAAHAVSEPEAYDLICLDLFDAGRLVKGTLDAPFLRQIAGLLAPDGTLTINLMVTRYTPDQVARVARVFAVTRRLKLRGNLVVHACHSPATPATSPRDAPGAGADDAGPRDER
jgi:SAM-dependent methyltransferase